MHRCTLIWLHQTLIEALSPWQWRVQKDTIWSLCGLETYPYPHTGLCKRVAERVPFSQLVPGSGEGQHTGTVGDQHRMARKEAHDMRSLPLLVTIFHYSIPAGMLGRGPHTLSTPCS